MFPDVSHQLIVVNSPSMISSVYQLFKHAFSEKSRDKIGFYSKDYKKKLIEDIGAENIYAKWGGTKVPKQGSPETGLLRMGDKPDDSLM